MAGPPLSARYGHRSFGGGGGRNTITGLPATPTKLRNGSVGTTPTYESRTVICQAVKLLQGLHALTGKHVDLSSVLGTVVKRGHLLEGKRAPRTV